MDESNPTANILLKKSTPTSLTCTVDKKHEDHLYVNSLHFFRYARSALGQRRRPVGLFLTAVRHLASHLTLTRAECIHSWGELSAHMRMVFHMTRTSSLEHSVRKRF